MLGNPASRRVAGFVEAADRLRVPVRVVSYGDFLSGRGAPPPPGSLVRIESPGECLATLQQLLRAGIAPMEAAGRTPLSASAIDRLESRRGEIVQPRQWYYGFCAVLDKLWSRWHRDDVQWMSTPRAIATTFDKLACLELWEQAGLPIPPRLRGVGSYDAIRASARQHHARLFVKLCYGYSAMGALALEWRGEKVRAITTVETTSENDEPRLFVTRRPRVLQDEGAIAWLIDKLAEYDIVVESWLPKDRWRGRSYDLRLVTIEGQVSHVVGRASATPFTNLNLDAERMTPADVRSRLEEHFPEASDLACRGAACLSEAAVLGIDLLVHPGGSRFTLLEANGFGDYLPGLLAEGKTTYEAQLEALLARRAVA